MPDIPASSTSIRDFIGLVAEIDQFDLPQGASDDQVNCISDDIGTLKSRLGYAVVKFEGE
jgi:hypothetical protein